MAVDTEVLVTELRAKMAQYEKQLLQAANKTDAELNRIQKKFAGTNRQLQRGLQTPNMGRALDRTFSNTRMAVISAGASRVGVFGEALAELGPAGLAAAAGVGALAFALNQARAAMTFADEISDAAVAAQVGVETLQEYRLAMVAVGGAEKDADEGLKAFSESLGKAQAGAAKSLKWFKLLGFTQDQLQSYRDAEDLLPVIADRIAALGSEAQRAAIAEGLGLRPMLPLLEEGSAGISKLITKMRDLGVIMDAEMVKKAGEAHDEAELLGKVIDLQLKMAFVQLAPVIVKAMQVIADMARGVREFSDDVGPAIGAIGDLIKMLAVLSGLKVGINFDLSSIEQVERRVASLLRLVAGLVPKARRVAGALDADAGRRELRSGVASIASGQYSLDSSLQAELAAAYGPRQQGPVVDFGNNRGASGSRSASADSAAREAERRRRAYDDAILEAERDELAALEDLAIEAEARAEIAADRSRLERTAYEEALARKVADKELDQSQADELLARRSHVEALQTQAREAKLAADKAAEAKALQEGLLDAQMQLLQLASANATTSTEARRIQLQILELSYQRLRAEQEAIIASAASTAAEKQLARAKLSMLNQGQALAVEGVNRSTAGPWEQFRRDAALTTDSMQQLAVDGLETLNQGLLDAAFNAKDLGDVARDVFLQIAQDLYKMALKSIQAGSSGGDMWSQLVNFAVSAFSGSSGSTAGHTTTNAPIPGFASGTDSAPGGLAYVHKDELINLPQGAQVIPSHALRAIGRLNPESMGAGQAGFTLNMPINLDARGADPSTAARLQASVNELRRDIPGLAKSAVQDGLDRRQIRIN